MQETNDYGGYLVSRTTLDKKSLLGKCKKLAEWLETPVPPSSCSCSVLRFLKKKKEFGIWFRKMCPCAAARIYYIRHCVTEVKKNSHQYYIHLA